MDASFTVARLIESMRGYFAARGIASARLDAELLLAHVLRKPRIYLYAHYDQPVSDPERDALRELARRRARREPMAYILGEQEFYGHALKVDRRVLVPRPETEALVDAARAYLQACATRRPRILDIGTGSGAIAIALALDVPTADVVACDVGADALAVARHNVDRHQLGERVTVVQCDVRSLAGGAHAAAAAPWAEPPFDVIVSNPPYLGEDERAELMPDVRDYEPGVALFAEDDGRAVLRAVLAVAEAHLAAVGLLAVEMAPRHAAWMERAYAALGAARIERDLAGLERVCLAWRGPWPYTGAAQPQSSTNPEATQGGEASQLEMPDLARD